MRSLTRSNRGGLRKTTAAGMIPLLLVQVVIALSWVPQTLEGRSEILRKMPWEQLPAFLEGEKKVTLMLSEGGAVRGEIIGVPDNGIHLGHVSMTTDERRFPTDSDALVPRSSVREIRVETLQGNRRTVRAVAGALGGLFLVPGMVAGLSGARSRGGVAAAAVLGMIVGSVGFGSLGYQSGKNADRETTIITIVD